VPLLTRYTFRADPNMTAWDHVQRLCDEVGWRVKFEDEAAERLRNTRVNMEASREQMTREQFIDKICQRAGLRFYAPVEHARVEVQRP
jgi:hypothetical protein